eukprot:344061-Pleurochrysis_carterae.AAC.1
MHEIEELDLAADASEQRRVCTKDVLEIDIRAYARMGVALGGTPPLDEHLTPRFRQMYMEIAALGDGNQTRVVAWAVRVYFLRQRRSGLTWQREKGN